MIIFIALLGVVILSLIVFGGGQVFMPLFKSLWHILNDFGANISDDKINHIFTIANATPGVISTKFALITGYLVASGEWWGWVLMFVTYLIFIIPAIVLIMIASKLVKKSDSSKHLSQMITYLKPVIAGIVFSLAIQLFIGTAFPQVVFNGIHEYIGIKSTMFSGWRLYILIGYTIFVIIESWYLYTYKHTNLFILIIVHIILGMLIFEPWLM